MLDVHIQIGKLFETESESNLETRIVKLVWNQFILTV